MPDFPLPVADLSTLLAAPGAMRYFVVFSSRDYTPTVPDTPGHAFVSWGVYDPIKSVCSYESYGLYLVDTPFNAVVAAAVGLIGPVPGEIEDESLNGFQSVGSIVDSLVVETDVGAYSLSRQVADNMSREPQPYMLGSNDCVSFVQKIAQNIGLTIPPREGLTNMPLNYIRSLKTSATAVQESPTFTGPMVQGSPAGFGTAKLPGGATWVGNMYGTSPVGTGIYTRPDGFVMHGQFGSSGKPDGLCSINYPDGSTVQGIFSQGIMNGFERMTYPDGRKFGGNYVNGEPLNGLYTYPDGYSIGGPIVNGQVQGVGFITWPDHSRYQGMISNGQGNGMGSYFWPDQHHVTGNFVNGALVGQPALPNMGPGGLFTPDPWDDDPGQPGTLVTWGGESEPLRQKRLGRRKRPEGRKPAKA